MRNIQYFYHGFVYKNAVYEWIDDFTLVTLPEQSKHEVKSE